MTRGAERRLEISLLAQEMAVMMGAFERSVVQVLEGTKPMAEVFRMFGQELERMAKVGQVAAEVEGRQAYRAGVPEELNPYGDGSELGGFWLKGWRSAEAVAMTVRRRG